MRIYDVSLTISPALPVWPGDPRVVLEAVTSMDEGAQANVSRLIMSVHTGTHVDAPHHFLNDKRTVENLSLDVLTGPCFVLELPDTIDLVNRDVLVNAQIPSGTVRLLFKTHNSVRWSAGEKKFYRDFVALAEDGARYLVEGGIRLVGVDYLSVAPFKQSIPTHTILLQAGVIILEGLDLSEVPPGSYSLYCLPLKLLGSDGAPARTILIG
jgi:arylformamidase